MNENEKHAELALLESQLEDAIKAEAHAKKTKAFIVQKIVDHPEVVESLKAKKFGSRTIGQIKVDRKEIRSWDQSALLQFAREHQPREKDFPFKIELKESLTDSKNLAEENPVAWALLLPFLTKKPGNPSIALAPKKSK